MRLVGRLFFSFFFTTLLSLVTAAFIGSMLLSRAVRSEAASRVDLGLKEARTFLEDLQEDLYITAVLSARGYDDDTIYPATPDILLTCRETPVGIDRTLSLDDSSRGFIFLRPEDLCRLDPALLPLSERSVCEGGTLLGLYGYYRGTLAAVILNENAGLIGEMSDRIFEKRTYRGKPFGTVTIFCRDTRAATSVIGPDGTAALGTRVSEEVRRQVLEKGERWLDRAFVVDEWYISAYEPILGASGNPEGILYVGVLEAYYRGIQHRTVTILLSLLLPALGIVLFAAWLLSRSIAEPVGSLVKGADLVASGNYDWEASAGEKAPKEIQALNQAFNAMKVTLKEREEALKIQTEELEEKNRDYQELLSFVTHELNNSIGSMLLNARILTEEFAGSISVDQAQAAEQILRDVERFRDMVKNYLNLSRLENGTLRYNPSPLELKSQVLEPVLKRLRSWVEHRDFKLRWDWPEEVRVAADVNLMDIVFSNLIINALKYGKEYILLEAQKKEGSWIISVVNGGEGIPEEKIGLLFRKFSRLVQSDDGVGLGLYLVRHIMDLHGGGVWCESGNEGTRFSLRLPADE